MMILQVLLKLVLQSTLPERGATNFFFKPIVIHITSIHAPRKRSDLLLIYRDTPTDNFNPRSPKEERL